jgi:hypothetical protein
MEHLWRGLDQLERGEDPTAALAEAEKACDRGIEINPQDVTGYDCRSERDLVAARALMAQGHDPEAMLLRCEEGARHQEGMNQQVAAARERLGRAALLRAEWRLLKGDDPSLALTEARRQFTRAVHHDRRSMPAATGRAESELIAARYAALSGRSPEEHLQSASRELAAAEALRAPVADTRTLAAEIEFERARWRSGSGAVAAVNEGLGAVERALAANPRRLRVHAVQAALRLRQAELLTRSDAPSQVAQAEVELQRLISNQPLLAQTFGRALGRPAAPSAVTRQALR